MGRFFFQECAEHYGRLDNFLGVLSNAKKTAKMKFGTDSSVLMLMI